MSTYVIKNAAGDIEMWDALPFPGSTLVDYEVVRGWDGRAYKAGEEPPRPVDSIVEAKRTAIDAETSSTITAGFEYAVDGVSYHFSYDAFDQQNFADTANVALLAQMGGKGLPESVAWNAYKNWQDGQGELVRLTFTAESFLALYTAGAVAHKAARMAEGGARKAALAEAVARGAKAEELEAI